MDFLRPGDTLYFLGIGAAVVVAACWVVIAALNRPEPTRTRRRRE